MPQKKAKIEPIHIEEAARLLRIFNARPSPKLSQAKFGEEFEIGSQGVVWQYLHARIPLNVEQATRFAKGLGCSVADFSPRLSAELAALHDRSSENAEYDAPSDDEYTLIPQYSAKGGCGPAYHNGHVEVRGGLAFKRDWLARMGLKPENLSAIAADGDSMAPTICDREVLLIDSSKTEPLDGQVFALARGEEMIVKRLIRDFAGGWIVRSDNQDKTRYGDVHVTDADLRIVGRVVWRGGGL